MCAVMTAIWLLLLLFISSRWLNGSKKTDAEGAPPRRRCWMNAGRLGMEETRRPTVCSARLSGFSLVSVGTRRAQLFGEYGEGLLTPRMKKRAA